MLAATLRDSSRLPRASTPHPGRASTTRTDQNLHDAGDAMYIRPRRVDHRPDPWDAGRRGDAGRKPGNAAAPRPVLPAAVAGDLAPPADVRSPSGMGTNNRPCLIKANVSGFDDADVEGCLECSGRTARDLRIIRTASRSQPDGGFSRTVRKPTEMRAAGRTWAQACEQPAIPRSEASRTPRAKESNR